MKAKNKAKESLIFPRGCRLLKDMDDGDFRRICECLQAQQLTLRPKETFIFESDACRRIGIVIRGAVQISRTRLDGHRNVFETVGENETFGATYVFRDVPTMGVNISAVGESKVLVFDITKIPHPCHKLCPAHMQFVSNLLAVMSQKIFQVKQKLRIVSERTIRARLMLFLHIRAKRAKSSEFDIPYNRQALADFLCVDRSALSAEISKLQKEGVIKVARSHFALVGKF